MQPQLGISSQVWQHGFVFGLTFPPTSPSPGPHHGPVALWAFFEASWIQKLRIPYELVEGAGWVCWDSLLCTRRGIKSAKSRWDQNTMGEEYTDTGSPHASFDRSNAKEEC